MTEQPINLLSLDRMSMERFFQGMGEKSFRAKQLLQWVYQRKVTQFADMTDLSKELRQRLDISTNLDLPEIVSQQRSRDGTIKWLLRLKDGNCIESVYIPEYSADGTARVAGLRSKPAAARSARASGATGSSPWGWWPAPGLRQTRTDPPSAR